MQSQRTLPWQRRRSRLNHDLFKNQLLPALAKWLNVLDDRIEDDAFDQYVVTSLLPSWSNLHRDAVALANTFEAEMSPVVFFESPPLNHSGSRETEWLRSLVHSLWLRRYTVKEMVSGVIQKAEVANETYSRLARALGEVTEESPSQRAVIRELGAEFRSRCRELSQAIGDFPSEVKPT